MSGPSAVATSIRWKEPTEKLMLRSTKPVASIMAKWKARTSAMYALRDAPAGRSRLALVPAHASSEVGTELASLAGERVPGRSRGRLRALGESVIEAWPEISDTHLCVP